MRLETVLRCSFIFAVLTTAAFAQSPEPSATQREDMEQAKILKGGADLLRLRKAQEAISNHFDPVIAHYEAKHSQEDRQIYCTRSMAEKIGVLAKHANEKPKTGAITVSSLWCDAYFLKAFALIELKRLDEAKSSLEQAISRSPFNSQYLSELGVIYVRERNWPKAMETFQAAEKVSDTATDEKIKKQQLARAKRGIGYVLIELNRLEEAEAQYRLCLEIDPNDSISRNQLVHIQRLKTKSGQ